MQYIDAWVYLGYFLNLKNYLHIFSSLYYGTRLPWIFPGYLVFNIFPPLIANYLLHLGVYYTSLLSLYIILKNLFNSRTALVTSLLMGSHIYFLNSIGWDYVDGAGNAYLLLTLMFLTISSKSKYQNICLIMSGISLGALIFTNLFLIIFIPFIIFYYFFICKEAKNDLKLVTFHIFTGAIVVTLFFAVINYFLSNEFIFFMPTLITLNKLLSHSNQWKSIDYSWVGIAYWLVWPTVIFLTSLIFLRRKMGNNSFILNLNFIILYILFLIMNLSDRAPVFQYFFYTSYLLPFMFLVIGSNLSVPFTHLNRIKYLVVILSVILLVLITFYLGPMTVFYLPLRIQLLTPALLAFFGLVFLKLNKGLIGVGVFFVLIILSNSVLFQFSIPIIRLKDNFLLLTKGEPQYISIVKATKIINDIDPLGEALFWYDKNEKEFSIYRSISSTRLWKWRLINENFPNMGDVNLNNKKVIILSEKPNTYLDIKTEMYKQNLIIDLIDDEFIKIRNVAFYLTLIEIRSN